MVVVAVVVVVEAIVVVVMVVMAIMVEAAVEVLKIMVVTSAQVMMWSKAHYEVGIYAVTNVVVECK